MILFDDIVKLSRRESDTIMEEDEFAIMDLLHRVSGRVFTLLKMLVVILMMGDQLVVDRTWVVHTIADGVNLWCTTNFTKLRRSTRLERISTSHVGYEVVFSRSVSKNVIIFFQ